MSNTNENITAMNNFVNTYNLFKQEISKVIVGQEDVVEQILISIFCKNFSRRDTVES